MEHKIKDIIIDKSDKNTSPTKKISIYFNIIEYKLILISKAKIKLKSGSGWNEICKKEIPLSKKEIENIKFTDIINDMISETNDKIETLAIVSNFFKNIDFMGVESN
jgi:hypothetical protein